MKKKTFKILAIIPARSGSKGIKDKNIQKINNKPLIAWSIDICKKSKLIDYFFISTDSKYYAKISKKYGCDVPFLRPKKISTDNSSDIDFMKHALEQLSKKNFFPEIVLNIRPTTPFRKVTIINNAIKYFLKNYKNYSSLRSVQEMSETSLKSLFVKNKLAKPIIKDFTMDSISLPRQKFKKTYIANGYIDIHKVTNILNRNCLYGEKVLAFKTEPTVEIDSMHDLHLARKLI